MEFDKAAFDRATDEYANAAMEQQRAELQRIFDAVYASHKGQPVTEVLTSLASAVREIGWEPSPDVLTPYAEGISQGRPVVWVVERS